MKNVPFYILYKDGSIEFLLKSYVSLQMRLKVTFDQDATSSFVF